MASGTTTGVAPEDPTIRETERQVAEQYTQFPYPKYKDMDKIREELSCAMINVVNQYCYGGRQDFSDFSILDAGCGTGDALLSLAKKFARIDGRHRIVGIDLSATSLAEAKRRLDHHGLGEYVELHQVSILDFPQFMEDGSMISCKFDYIVCNGVLHHLENPLLGLQALTRVLKPNGCMYIMMYAKYARIPTDLIQQFLRKITEGIPDREQKLAVARATLDMLPDSHPFKTVRSPDLEMGDAGIYDLVLHYRNHMLSVPELFDLIKGAGLTFVRFTHNAYLYDPIETFNEPLLSYILSLPEEKQYEMCELFRCSIANHYFLLSASDKDTISVDPNNMDYVPQFAPIVIKDIRKTVLTSEKEGGKLNIKLNDEVVICIDINRAVKEFIRLVDDRLTMREIVITGCNATKIPPKKFIKDIQEFINVCMSHLILTFRHKDAIIQYIDPQ